MADLNAAGGASGLSDNAAGAIAYLTFIPAVCFLIMEPYNKNSYIRFHAWQSIMLFIVVVAVRHGAEFCAGVCARVLPFPSSGYMAS